MDRETPQKIDERIETDLKELYQLLTKQQIVLRDIEKAKPISAAQKLSEKLFGGNGKIDDAYALSCYGLPGYFTGDREAKTVMVMLNPGIDAMANDNPFYTLYSLRNYGISLDSDIEKDFIRKCNEGYRDFGKYPSYKVDNFDLKQAVFLSGWEDTGVDVPDDSSDELIKNRGKKISSSVKKNVDNWWKEYLKRADLQEPESRAATYKEILCEINGSLDLPRNDLQEVLAQIKILYLKQEAARNVLTQKLQLELIPYASRKFDTNTKNFEALMPYLATLLQEIFRTDRKYVIFCSAFFDKLLDFADGKIATIETLLEDNMDLFSEKEGKNKKAHCKVIMITYGGYLPKKALIAHTFPNQSLSNTYDKMQEYGKFCYKCWTNS